MVQAVPGSLSEGAVSPQGLTEGVSSDGCFGPTVCASAHINSEIHERLRSSKYTPSVSHSLDSSLREGAGDELHHPPDRPEAARFRAIFIAPTKAQKSLHFTIQRTTLPQSRIRSAAPSEREPGMSCTIHPTARKPKSFGRFSSPYGTLNVLLFSFKLYYAIVIPQIPGVGICGINVLRLV